VTTGVTIPLKVLLADPTVTGLAAAIERAGAAAPAP
jgi:hypothetical protein